MWEIFLILISILIIGLGAYFVLCYFCPRQNPCGRASKLCCVLPMKTFFLLLILEVTDCFKLPSLNLDLDTNVANAHDQISDSIVNSTITSVNLSIVHVASEIVLLILIICSHKKLSGLIYKISLYLLNSKKMLRETSDPQKVTTV